MIDFGIIVPFNNFEIVSEFDQGSSNKYLDSVSSYNISLDREGSLFNSFGDLIWIRIVSGQIGSNPNKRTKPFSHGLMPRNFSKSMDFVVSYDSGDQEDFLGQDEMFVRELLPFRIEGHSDLSKAYSKDSNSRMFSFNGDLFILFEKYHWIGETYAGFVNLYKYDESSGIYRLVQVFDNFTDQSSIGWRNYQIGSPDYLIHNGVLSIYYRAVNRSNGKNEILVYQPDDSDMVEWSVVNRFFIDSRETDYDQFRLRVSSSNDVIMLVAMGVKSIERATGQDDEIRDFIQYVSFDGFKFDTIERETSSVVLNSVGSIKTGVVINPVYNLFFAENTTLTAGIFTGTNVNFDMYFDIDLGSFVIFMSGQPASWLNNGTYLMAIKTSPSNLFEWDICCRYRLNMGANQDALFKPDGSYDVQYLDPNESTDNSYRIEDVCIVPSYGRNVIAIQSTKVFSQFGKSGFKGVSLTEFRFVPDSLIPPGNYEEIFAYGGKFHPDVSFFCGVINHDTYGLYGSSSHYGFEGEMSGLMACIHLNQFYCSVKNDIEGQDGRREVIRMKSWGKVNEKYPYQFFAALNHDRIDYYGLEVEQTAFGTSTYESDLENNSINIDINTTTEFLYLKLLDGVPHVMDRVDSDHIIWKSRFKIKFQGLSGSYSTFFPRWSFRWYKWQGDEFIC